MKYILILSMIICNACYGQDMNENYKTEKYKLKKSFGWPDSIPSSDPGETTISIITSKKHQDTVKVYATIRNKSTKKQYSAFIYDVMQEYKKVDQEPFAKPHYYFQHIKYLGQNKKYLPKNLTVIKATELK